MRRTVMLALVGLLVASGPPVVRAATPQTVHPAAGAAAQALLSLPTFDPLAQGVRSASDYAAQGFSRADALKLQLLGDLVSSGVPRSAIGVRARRHDTAGPVTLPCNTRSFNTLFYPPTMAPAGDLNGDGRPDVLEAHGSQVNTKKNTYRWDGFARDARSGRPAWHRSQVLHLNQFVGLLPARVGRTDREGALLLQITEDSTGSPLDFDLTLRLHLEGLDGRGRTTWVQNSVGTLHVGTFVWTYHNFPSHLYLHQFRIGADDLLIQRLEGSNSASSLTVERIFAETGALSHPYPTQSATGSTDLLGLVKDLIFPNDLSMRLNIVPDQNGDRRDDVLLLRSQGLTASAAVYRGDTGKPIWANDALLPVTGFYHVVDAGVLTQGETKIHDLVIAGPSAVGLGLDATVYSNDRLESLVQLLQGGSGTFLWALPGTGVFAMHLYKGAPAIGIVSSSNAVTTDLTTRVTVEVDVVAANGVVQAINTYDSPQQTTTCYQISIWFENIEDLTGDGIPEAFVTNVEWGALQGSSSVMAIRGAEGTVLDRVQAYPLNETFDGRGADRASATWTPTALVYTVVKGDAATVPLVRLTLPVQGNNRFAFVSAGRVLSRKCSDLFADTGNPTVETLTLFAGNGKPWWALTITDAKPLGQLTTGKGAREVC